MIHSIHLDQLKNNSFNGSSAVELQAFTTDLNSAYAPFKPNKSGQRLDPPYYRGCWHGVSRSLFVWYRQPRHVGGFFPYKSSLQPIGPSSCTRHGWIRLSSIVQYSLLLPPVGVWSVSQYQCGGSSSQTPYHRSLGEPLPHQLTNGPHAHLNRRSFNYYKMP